MGRAHNHQSATVADFTGLFGARRGLPDGVHSDRDWGTTLTDKNISRLLQQFQGAGDTETRVRNEAVLLLNNLSPIELERPSAQKLITTLTDEFVTFFMWRTGSSALRRGRGFCGLAADQDDVRLFHVQTTATQLIAQEATARLRNSTMDLTDWHALVGTQSRKTIGQTLTSEIAPNQPRTLNHLLSKSQQEELQALVTREQSTGQPVLPSLPENRWTGVFMSWHAPFTKNKLAALLHQAARKHLDEITNN